MKLTAIFLSLPLVLGSGALMAADMSTTTESTSTSSGMPAASTESKTKIEKHDGVFGDTTVEKNKSVSQNADGSVSMEKSKSVTKE